MSGGVGIVTTREVSVVGCDYSVLLAFLGVLSVPLANTGTTGVG